MLVRRLTSNRIDNALYIYNEDEINNIYSFLDKAEFISKFLNRNEVESVIYEAIDENEKTIGIIVCDYKKEYLRDETFDNTPGYISFLKTDINHRRKGVGSFLVDTALDFFRSIGKKTVAITYRNPINLEWHVPFDQTIKHNNAPGVVVDSAAFHLFKKKGFAETRVEDGLFLPLDGFILSEKYYEKRNNLEKNNIQIEFYNHEEHFGFDDLFDALHGEVWRKTIHDNEALDKPLPVLVASDCNKIVGFAGPISKEKNGRGWFNGIATHPDYERRGIAFVLFSRLMQEFKEIGARFSTIFTDEENPALILYKKVGFTVGERFSIMERSL